MVDIVGINSAQNHANRVTERGSAKNVGSKTRESSSSSSSSSGDRIEISAGAKEASAVSRLMGLAQAEPDVRPEAVAEAREKLANGEFEGLDVSRDAAKKILGVE
jgi:anti-sigma28 factor (negative regulator of flagellin synthesis)